jgi:hypothetical protein
MLKHASLMMIYTRFRTFTSLYSHRFLLNQPGIGNGRALAAASMIRSTPSKNNPQARGKFYIP